MNGKLRISFEIIARLRRHILAKNFGEELTSVRGLQIFFTLTSFSPRFNNFCVNDLKGSVGFGRFVKTVIVFVKPSFEIVSKTNVAVIF